MKRLFLIIIIIHSFLSGLHPQTNRALFIAVEKYPEGSGWRKINSSNDSRLLIPLLRNYGYNKRNITVLQNENATKAAIQQAFKNLEAATQVGDCVYIHFSCHGQQMVDDNDDEADGLDEALIPYDASRRYHEGKYVGDRHIRDDELEVWLDAIRTKATAGGNVIVVLDACHSGTGTREGDDEEFIRGTSYVFAPDGYVPSGKTTKGNTTLTLRKTPQMAPLSVFSACIDKEKNYEYFDKKRGVHCGSLSYALGVLLKENTVGRSSGRQLAKRLEAIMNEMFAEERWTQTPFFESTNEDNILHFGN